MPILRHIHLPGLTRYSHASHLQSTLVSEFLSYKAAASISSASSTSLPNQPPPPVPTILTFQTYPIYTTGRREIRVNPPAPSLLEYLTTTPLESKKYGLQTAGYEHALRGGQITFHGPGQLVIYPIFSLAHPESFPLPTSNSSPDFERSERSGISSNILGKPHLTPRAYISLLEKTTIASLQQYDIPSTTSSTNPGVWLTRDEDLKIAALGVHLRRNVASHGVGLNVATDLRWFKRIVACGLEGKGAASMEGELRGLEGLEGKAKEGRARGDEEKILDVEAVATVWVNEFASAVGLREADVVRVTEDDVFV